MNVMKQQREMLIGLLFFLPPLFFFPLFLKFEYQVLRVFKF